MYLQSSIRNAMIGLLAKIQNVAYTTISLVAMLRLQLELCLW